MKKVIFISLVCALMVFLFSCGSVDSDVGDQRRIEYCREINHLLEMEEFITAKIDEGFITLFDSEREIIKEIALPNYDKSIDIIYIRKENSAIYFITSGAVDDEEGYMFINGDENKIFDGLWSVERVTGNGYAYSTAKR